MTYNRLLDALPNRIYAQLQPYLTTVSLHQGEILHTPGDVIKNVYFPVNCMLSITITMADGSTAETGVVGNREVLGINAIMGGRETTQTEYVVQVAGEAVQIAASELQLLFAQNTAVRSLFLNYAQALIAQLSQTTACNRLHKLEQRFARWLLEAQDRLESEEIPLTQRFIAEMLGVRRAGVTQAAQKLEDLNIISYSRGHIRILDKPALKDIACECFGVVREEYDRLLGLKYDRQHDRG
jgi:CRP-like cAMP-binding protein